MTSLILGSIRTSFAPFASLTQTEPAAAAIPQGWPPRTTFAAICAPPVAAWPEPPAAARSRAAAIVAIAIVRIGAHGRRG